EISHMVDDVLVSFAQQSVSLQTGFATSATQTMESLTAYSDRFSQTMVDHLTLFDESIAAHGETLEKKFSSDSSRIQECITSYVARMSEQADLISQDMAQRMDAFQEITTAHGEALTAQTAQLHEQLAKVAAETYMTLGMNGEKLTESLNDRLQLFQDT